jgi:hypothetical protein
MDRSQMPSASLATAHICGNPIDSPWRPVIAMSQYLIQSIPNTAIKQNMQNSLQVDQ